MMILQCIENLRMHKYYNFCICLCHWFVNITWNENWNNQVNDRVDLFICTTILLLPEKKTAKSDYERGVCVCVVYKKLKWKYIFNNPNNSITVTYIVISMTYSYHKIDLTLKLNYFVNYINSYVNDYKCYSICINM